MYKRQVRRRAIESIAAALEPSVSLDDGARKRAASNEVARFALMLLDGAFVARQIDGESMKTRELFTTVATGVRAMLDHLTAQARADASAGARTRRKQ